MDQQSGLVAAKAWQSGLVAAKVWQSGLVAAIDLHSGILSVDGDDVWFLFSARAWPDCLQAYEQLARALRLAERLTSLASYERCARARKREGVCAIICLSIYLSIYLCVCLSIYTVCYLRLLC